MPRPESQFVTPAGLAAAAHLGALVRQARLSRGWSQEAAAERARVSRLTWLRIEKGAPQVSLGAWLSAFEIVGLLPLLAAIEDPASRAVLDATRASDPRRTRMTDLDF